METNIDERLKQSQRLIITPQIQQGLEILQLPCIELYEYLRVQVESNPLLEMDDSLNAVIEDSLADYVEDSPADWDDYFTDEDYYDNSYIVKDGHKNDLYYENLDNYEESLQNYLLSQLIFLDISETDMRIAHYIIENLDDNGYINLSKYEIAEILGIDRQTVSKVLSIIQQLDPPGVAARSLRECLIIQLRRKGLLTSDIQGVILGALRELSENRLNHIAKQFGLSIQRVQEISEIVRQLEPKPGRGFASGNALKYIVPDIIVTKHENEYFVTLNNNVMPVLRINQFYKKLLNMDEADESVTSYVSQKMQEALWLMRCVEQRNITLQKAASAIVEQQKEFFERGIKFLRPLTLKDIANIVGMHESTISRAISGKYMQTSRGLFDMKFFFASGINTVEGKSISSAAIKELITEIITSENPLKPLSDNAITKALNKKGIKISRRTVAKYRDNMAIPSSEKRKKDIDF